MTSPDAPNYPALPQPVFRGRVPSRHTSDMYGLEPDGRRRMEQGASTDFAYYERLSNNNEAGEFNDVLYPPLVGVPRSRPPLDQEVYPKGTPFDNEQRHAVHKELAAESIASARQEMDSIFVELSHYLNIQGIRAATEEQKKQFPGHSEQFDRELLAAETKHQESVQSFQARMHEHIQQHPSTVGMIEEMVAERRKHQAEEENRVQQATRAAIGATAVRTGSHHPSAPQAFASAETDDRMAKQFFSRKQNEAVQRLKALEAENALLIEVLRGVQDSERELPIVEVLIDLDGHRKEAHTALANVVVSNDPESEHQLYAAAVRLRNDVQSIRDWKESVDESSTAPEDRQYTDRRLAEVYRQYATIEHARRRLRNERQSRNADGSLERDENDALLTLGSVEFARYEVRDADGNVVGGFTDGSIVATRQSTDGGTETVALYPDGSHRPMHTLDGTWGSRIDVAGNRVEGSSGRGQLTKNELSVFDPRKVKPEHDYFFDDEQGEIPSPEQFVRNERYLQTIQARISKARTQWLATAGGEKADAKLREVLIYARTSLADFATWPGGESAFTEEQWRDNEGVRRTLELLHQADFIQATLDNNRTAVAGKRFRRQTILPYRVRPDGYVDVRDPNNPDFRYRLMPDGSRYYNGRMYRPNEAGPIFEPPTPPAPVPTPPATPPMPSSPPPIPAPAAAPVMPPMPSYAPPTPPAPVLPQPYPVFPPLRAPDGTVLPPRPEADSSYPDDPDDLWLS